MVANSRKKPGGYLARLTEDIASVPEDALVGEGFERRSARQGLRLTQAFIANGQEAMWRLPPRRGRGAGRAARTPR